MLPAQLLPHGRCRVRVVPRVTQKCAAPEQLQAKQSRASGDRFGFIERRFGIVGSVDREIDPRIVTESIRKCPAVYARPRICDRFDGDLERACLPYRVRQ